MLKYVLIGLAVYLLVINVITFAAYGIDKHKARHHERRISEASLLELSFVGGWLGAFIGMKVFHHKVRKWKFRVLVPLSFLLWVAAAVGIFYLTHRG